ncbi:MAG: hypothetical protein K2H84_03410, partial [Paramuribaculum sp.]|nr:hypothetical protein [Paramuribaculum sp.]
MKKLLLLLTIFVTFPAAAQYFTYEYDGQTLEYQIISFSAKTCRTKPGEALADGGFKAGNKVSGNLIIPDYAVDSAGVSYKVTQIGNGGFTECDE